MTKIRKSKGVTPTEKFLSDLCERTFLKLWSYPNPYKEDGKELCDLIAVFEDHVFVFFDRKSGRLDNLPKDLSLKWKRWKKEVIDKQIKTSKGAERYISDGNPIFLDDRCETALPVEIPKNAKIHKFIVAHGAEEACKDSSSNNVYGSLGICYEEPSKHRPDSPFSAELEELEKRLKKLPFLISMKKDDPVHILDSFNLEIVMGELDTIFDFTSFITEKEDAIGRYRSLIYCGEEDLLAHYFLNYDEKHSRYRIGTDEKDVSSIMIEEGKWKDFAESEHYRNRKKENEVSYCWDRLLQKTCQNALDGTLTGDVDLKRTENLIREMAKEPRATRRFLSEQIRKAIETFPESEHTVERKLTFMSSSVYPDKGYVFLQVKCPQIRNDKIDYIESRRHMLTIACGAAKNRFPHLNTVVGIAIDSPKFAREVSEDFALLDCSEWSEEVSEYYERENEDLEFFKSGNQVKTERSVKDFPT